MSESTKKPRTRFKPATAEKYAEGAERELGYLQMLENQLTIEDNRHELQMRNAGVVAGVKAQLAQTSATVRLAEATERHNELLVQLGGLIETIANAHPVLSHVFATRNLIAEQGEKLVAAAERIAELELAVQAAEQPKKEEPDAPRPN